LVAAQDQVVERTVKGPSNKEFRVGIYGQFKARLHERATALDQTNLISPPEHGKVTVKQGTVNATNYRQCLAVQVPGFVAFYQSTQNFSGTDSISLEVKTPGGRIVIQKITVLVGGAGQPI
jgi:hypothetical protein